MQRRNLKSYLRIVTLFNFDELKKMFVCVCFLLQTKRKKWSSLGKESHWVVTQAFPLIDEFGAIYGKAGQIVSSIKMNVSLMMK